MKTTVKEIRAMLAGLPDDLPVDFMPITDAWLGSSYPMRFGEIHFWDENGETALPDEDNARCEVYLKEDTR